MVAKRKTIFYIIIFILAVLVITFFYNNRVRIGRIITPFVMALVISYLVNPLVERLKRKNISCTVSILLIYSSFAILIVSTAVFIIPELSNNTRELMNTLPEIASKYQIIFNRILSIIKSSNWSTDIKNVMFKEIDNGTLLVQSYITDTLKKSLATFVETITMLFDLVLSMVIAYYFIKDSAFFKSAALSLVPRKWRNGIIGAGREIDAILSNFIQGQVLTALIIGVMETIGLIIVKVKYPLILGVIGGVANIIPYFGPIIGAVPAVAVALIESPMKAVWTALVFVIVQQIDNSFVSPKIIEGRLGLHPVTTILAVLVGGEFFGIPGMLIAVPVTAIIKVIVQQTIEAIV